MNEEENNMKNDILFQIDMQLYDEFNDTIATMNDNLGNIYSLRDVEEVEKAEKEKEVKLLREAIKKQQKEIKKKDAIIDKIAKAFKQDDIRNVEKIIKYCTNLVERRINNMGIEEEWLRKIFDEYDKKISDEYKEIKAKSYGVDIRDSFSICLRDEFNTNVGKRIAFVQLKNKILEKQEN